MAMRLCAIRGELRPTLALQCMSAADVALYQAWFQQHRFGDDYLHLMIAQLTALVRNSWHKGEPRQTKDFIPWYEEPDQSPEEMLAVIREAKLGSSGKY